MASITLTKHHGLGNDFLIAVAPGVILDADDAVAWCDRKRGVGADGLIVARPGDHPDQWSMTLWNADGSRAEVSGNGLRCLGQALLLHHDGGEATKSYLIATDAGPRRLDIRPDRAAPTDRVTVNMGRPSVGPAPYAGWIDLGIPIDDQLGVDMGNPHLVVLVEHPDAVDLSKVGPAVEAEYADGMNVELIAAPDRGHLELRVWERGAHITEACGSGACAAAWAAHRWGLVDDRVEVVMPGGTATVDLIDGEAVLTGPATFVAIVEIERP